MNGHNRPASRHDFQVAIISALPLENNAVLCSLDEHWDDANYVYGRAEGDPTQYRFGRCGGQPVVIVILHKIGMEAATTAAQSLRMSFPSINLVLLVGVCGAVPWTPDEKKTEIVLGDVIVSEVLVQLDNIRQYPHGTQRRQDTIYDSPMKPSEEVIGLLQCLKTQAELNSLRKKMMDNLGELLRKPSMDTSCPPVSEDKLFESNYIHRHHSGCPECSTLKSVCNAALKSSCDAISCDDARLIQRERLLAQVNGAPPNHMIHFGSIGTGNVVMKSAEHRDECAKSEKVIGFEMEGAGIWNKFNCLIIKGVCDYADSHKNKKWQKYAAAVAASVAKGVLGYYAPHDRRSQSGTPDSRSELSSRTSNLSRTRLDPQSLGLVDDSLPREIFNRIFNGFEREFDSSKVNVYRTTDLRTLKRELKHIQNEQERTKTLRNLRRIEPFIVKFEHYGGVLQSILGTAELMGFIWGPVKELIQKAKAQVDTLDALLTAYEEIGEALPSFGDQLEAFRHNVGLQRILARIFVDVTEFHHNALRVYLGGALKVVFKSLWKDFNPTYKSIMLRIQSHTRLIEDKARASYSHPGQYDMREIRDYLEEKEKETHDCEVKETERRKKEIDEVQSWIGGAESYTQHQDISRDRNLYRGSGSWILDQEKVQGWLSTDLEEYSSLLWVNGHPGTGKTYLASVIIDACREHSNGKTCYFYCNEKVETKSSGLSVLRGILLQLIPKDEDLVPYCLSKKRSSHTSNISDLSTAQTLIETFCERLPRLNMVIDGLDECEYARKELLETFKNLIKKAEDSSPGKLRVLFLSRPLPEIRSAIPNASVIALEPANAMGDIRSYCQQRRTRELEKFQSEERLINDAVDTICIKSHGMFLFARLVMDNLQKQSTIADFKKEISPTILPGELHDAYSRIMERLKRDLSPGQLKYTRLLLGWLVYAKRPLDWTEIQVALSIDMELPDTNELDMDLRIRDEPEELCGSLVQKLKGNKFELIHSTARQFIEDTDYINWRTAECDLAVRCLRYLTLDLFKPYISDRDLKKYARRGDLAFQDYAVAFWYRHIRALIDQKAAFLGESIMQREYNAASQVPTVTQELANFVSFYADAFPYHVPEQALRDCEFFQEYPFHGHLTRVWGHIYTAQQGDLKARNSVSIPTLKETLTRNRDLLEKLSEDRQLDFSLYDDRPFRCPRVMCSNFHWGFPGRAQRQDHGSQHDLPFRCKDENCERFTHGFRSNNDLAAHEKKYHPADRDLGDSFANIHRREVTQTKYTCQICSKSFTRRNILEDHIRAHNGEKPFRCSECGKEFTRKWDTKRHEKIHDKERAYPWTRVT